MNKQHIMAVLRRRNGDNCGICGYRIWFDAPVTVLVGMATHLHPCAPSIDHIRPRKLGGGNGIDNLRLAHRWCNHRRGHTDEQFTHERKFKRKILEKLEQVFGVDRLVWP